MTSDGGVGRLLAAAAGIVVVVAVATGALAFTLLRSDDGPEGPQLEEAEVDRPEWDYVIPSGTALRIAHGADVSILPDELNARVGESIRIENRDSQPHTLGPFFVGAGETMTQRFTTAGVYEGVCTADPGGELRLVVED